MRHFDLTDTRPRAVVIALVLAIMLGSIVDLVLDEPDSFLSAHVIFELGLIALCLGTAIFLWRVGFQAERNLRRTREALAHHDAELATWRSRAERLLAGLGAEIDRQMREWGLSPAEREVALLLLKGFSSKEIAVHLGKSERTVRQQCSDVYRRSGLGGRAELSAFFLEDLLLPAGDEPTPTP